MPAASLVQAKTIPAKVINSQKNTEKPQEKPAKNSQENIIGKAIVENSGVEPPVAPDPIPAITINNGQPNPAYVVARFHDRVPEFCTEDKGKAFPGEKIDRFGTKQELVEHDPLRQAPYNFTTGEINQLAFDLTLEAGQREWRVAYKPLYEGKRVKMGVTIKPEVLSEDLNFMGRDLSNARIINSEFNNGNHSASNLNKALFLQGEFNAADFTRSIANNVTFRQTKFKRVDFTGAQLRNALFESADFSYLNFDVANLEGAQFKGVDHLAGSNLSFKAANLTNATIGAGKPPEMVFSSSDMPHRGNFANIEALRANFRNADLKDGLFGCQVEAKYANFAGADLEGAFGDANTPGANFSNANIIRANFMGGDLRYSLFLNNDQADVAYTSASKLNHAIIIANNLSASLFGQVPKENLNGLIYFRDWDGNDLVDNPLNTIFPGDFDFDKLVETGTPSDENYHKTYNLATAKDGSVPIADDQIESGVILELFAAHPQFMQKFDLSKLTNIRWIIVNPTVENLRFIADNPQIFAELDFGNCSINELNQSIGKLEPSYRKLILSIMRRENQAQTKNFLEAERDNFLNHESPGEQTSNTTSQD